MFESIEHWQVNKKAVFSREGVVAAQHTVAAQAGASILASGGNAVDAAVATAFALGCVEPWMCGLGGSGYMVVWDARAASARVYDFQGVLPGSISTEDYPLDATVPESIMGFPGVVNDLNTVGYRSIAVPGAVKGLTTALARDGRLGLDTVLKPAIALAEKGLEGNWFTTLQIALATRYLQQDAAAKACYLPEGVPPQPEQRLYLDPLGSTLRCIADQGPDVFYRGVLSEKMVADLQAGGSKIDQQDFADYRVIESESLQGLHRGVQLHTAGPTSGGPRLIETLAHIEASLSLTEQPGPNSWQVYAAGLNKAWRSHNARIGRATEVGGCTSHLSCVDSDGNMVALTYTLLSRFGSCVVLPQTGILMNNSVSYFDPRPGYPTSMAGNKRINASNMCPTIATRDNESLFALGASGANFIMPCTTQVAALMLDFNLTLEHAINHPRLDVSEHGTVRADPRLGDAVIEQLGKTHAVERAQLLVYPKLYACPSGVSRNPDSGELFGANDPSQPVGGAVSVEMVRHLERQEQSGGNELNR